MDISTCILIFSFFSFSRSNPPLVSADPTVIRVGMIFRNDSSVMPDNAIHPAIAVAADDMREIYNIKMVTSTKNNMSYPCLPDAGTASRAEAFIKTFNFNYQPPFGFDPATGNPYPTTAILGPYCSNKVKASVIAGTAFNIPQFTGGAQDMPTTE